MTQLRIFARLWDLSSNYTQRQTHSLLCLPPLFSLSPLLCQPSLVGAGSLAFRAATFCALCSWLSRILIRLSSGDGRQLL